MGVTLRPLDLPDFPWDLLAPYVTSKGALVGLQWALRMHGFGGAADHLDAPPAPRPAGE